MKEKTLFRIELLRSTAYNDAGEILKIKYLDNKGNMYYYDGCKRWCYLNMYDNKKDFKRIKSKDDLEICPACKGSGEIFVMLEFSGSPVKCKCNNGYIKAN